MVAIKAPFHEQQQQYMNAWKGRASSRRNGQYTTPSSASVLAAAAGHEIESKQTRSKTSQRTCPPHPKTPVSKPPERSPWGKEAVARVP